MRVKPANGRVRAQKESAHFNNTENSKLTEPSAEGSKNSRVFVNKTQEVWSTILENPNISETELNVHLSHMSAGTIGASIKMLFDQGHITREGIGQYNQRKRELYRFTGNPNKPYEPSYGTRPFVNENMKVATSTRTVPRRPGKADLVCDQEESALIQRPIVHVHLEIGNRAARIPVEEARRLYHDLRQFFEAENSQQVSPR
jgi:hypothetical protein